MKKVKKYLVGILFLSLILVVSACGNNGKENANSSDDSWVEKVNLNDYETTEELYEKAKEEGEVSIYTGTSALEEIGVLFEKEYPGVKANVTKMGDAEILERLRRESEANIFNADIVFGKGTNGAWVNELLSDNIIHDYKPSEITDNLVSPYDTNPGLGIISEIITVIYNTNTYDSPPFDNWWDLTTPEWQGRIMMKDPLQAADIQGLFMTMVKHSDEMEDAYVDKFGEELTLNGTDNAGYEFIKRLMENDVILMSSMGDTVDSVAESTSDAPPVAIASTTKLRDVINKDAPIGISLELAPKVSVPDITKIFVVDQSPNVSATKLFIRWMSGGEDGNGEGFSPLSDNPGVFPNRKDFNKENPLGLPTIDELNVWEQDENYYYENEDDMRNFLLKIQ